MYFFLIQYVELVNVQYESWREYDNDMITGNFRFAFRAINIFWKKMHQDASEQIE